MFEKNEHKSVTKSNTYIEGTYTVCKPAGVSASEHRRGGVLSLAFVKLSAFAIYHLCPQTIANAR